MSAMYTQIDEFGLSAFPKAGTGTANEIYSYFTTVPYVLSAKQNSCQCLLCESIYYDLAIIN